MHLFAVKEHLSAGDLFNSEQHLHQGGLSGTVFPHQGVDLALVDAEIDVIIGENSARINFCQILDP